MRQFASFAFAAVCLMATSIQAEILATRLNPSNGHTYHLLDLATWREAEAQAVDLGGHLVTVNDRAEDDWLGDTFLPFSDHGYFWIGLSDREEEGVWKWTSGEPFVYSNWQPGEPNDSGAGEDFAAKDYPGHVGDWNDATGEQTTNNGIVEISVPEPMSLQLAACALVGFGLRRWQRSQTFLDVSTWI